MSKLWKMKMTMKPNCEVEAIRDIVLPDYKTTGLIPAWKLSVADGFSVAFKKAQSLRYILDGIWVD